VYPPLVRKIRLALYVIGLALVVLGAALKSHHTVWAVLCIVVGLLSFVTVFLVGSLARVAKQHAEEQAKLARRGKRPPSQRRR
jgi:hypothetical protein